MQFVRASRAPGPFCVGSRVTTLFAQQPLEDGPGKQRRRPHLIDHVYVCAVVDEQFQDLSLEEQQMQTCM